MGLARAALMASGIGLRFLSHLVGEFILSNRLDSQIFFKKHGKVETW
jgi:hypothetical protein